MRNTTKKLLVLIAVVAVMVAALVVSSSAYISWDEETATFPGGTNSAYADINSVAWVQVGAPAEVKDADGTYTGEGALGKIGASKTYAYFNETTSTLVIESEGYDITGGSGDYNRAQMFAAWCKANAAKVTTLEIRNVSGFNNVAYLIDLLQALRLSSSTAP